MDYQLSGIKMSVYLGNQDKAKQELAELIKKLENNKITINVDFEDVKKQISTITKAYEDANKNQISAVQKTQTTIKKIYKTSNDEIKKMVETQRKLLESEYENKGKVGYTYTTDSFGNSQITSAFVEIKNQAQETEKVMFGLKESINTVGNEIQKIYEFDNVGKKEILNLKQNDESLKKFSNTVNNTRAKYENEINKILIKNGELANDKGLLEFQARLKRLDNTNFDDLQQEIKELQLQFNSLKTGFSEQGLLGKTSSNLFARVGQYFTSTMIYSEFAQAIRFGVNSVLELDTAMVDLKKVTDETDSIYNKFVGTANKMAIALGNTTKGVIDSTTEFARMGYSLQDAMKMAESNTIYSNVADLDATTAAQHMISVMKAFKVEAKDSIELIDKINEVSNRYSISASGVGEALKRSSSALVAANNDLSESIALITSANTVSQDPELVGQALKSISLSLQGINEESGELVPKFRELMLLNTNYKVDIWDKQKNAFKSTYQIMTEMSAVWDELNNKQQAFIAAKVAGKHRANVFYSLMESGELLKDVYETAESSAGSAYKEQEKYMQSLNASINELKESAVGLFQSLIDEGFLKDLLSIGTGAINVLRFMVDGFGALPVVITAVTTSIMLMSKSFHSIENGSQITYGLVGAFGKLNTKVMAQGFSLKALTSAINMTKVATLALNSALTLGLAFGIQFIVEGIMKLVNHNKNLQESFDKSVDSLKGVTDKVNENISKMRELEPEYERLKKGVNSLGENVSLTNEQYDRYNEIVKQIVEVNPSLVKGYTDENNAIIDKNISLKEQIALQEELLKAEKAKNVVAFKDNQGNMKDRAKDIVSALGSGVGSMQDAIDQVAFSSVTSMDVEGNPVVVTSKNINEELVKLNKMKNDAITQQEKDSIQNTIELLEIANGNYRKMVEDSNAEIQAQLATANADKSKFNQEARDAFKNNLELQKDYNDLTKESKSLMDDYISSIDFSKLYANGGDFYEIEDMINGQLQSIQGYGNEIKLLADKKRELQSTKLVDGDEAYFKNLELAAKKLNIPLSELDSLVNVLAQNMFDLGDSVENTLDPITGLAKSLDEVVSGFEDVNKTLDDQADKIKTYNELIQKMQEGTKLTSEEVYELVKSNGELAPLLEEVDGMYKINVSSLEDLRNTALKTTRDKMNADLQDIESVRNKTLANLQSYGLEIEGLKNLAQARNAVQRKVSDIMGGDGSTADKYNKLQSSGLLGQKLNQDLETYYEVESKYQEIQAKMNALENKKFGYDTTKKKEKKSDDPFQKDVDKIKQAREEIEREIGIIQSKLDLSEMQGDSKAFDEYSNKMTLLLAKQKELADVEVSKFNALKGKYKKEEEQLTLNEAIAESTRAKYADEKEYLEQSISLIQRKTDLEKQSYDDKIKQLELSQMLMDENSDAYMKSEEEKILALTKLQEGYQDAIIKLKAQGFNDEHKYIREYINLYNDAEMEKFNIVKSASEKTKEIQLKTIQDTIDKLEKQKDAQKKVYDTIISMIKKEQELKKKGIQEEISGYEAIINAKKRALKDDYDKENSAEELAEKEKMLKDIDNQLLLLQGVEGEDAKEKRIKLEQEKADAIKEINKFNKDQLLQSQQDMLDKELQNFKDEKQSEIDEIDKFLDSEGKLRDEALKRMDKNNKALYNQLKKYSNEYTQMAGSEFDELWNTANEQIEGYTDRNLTLLDTLKLVTDELKKQQSLQKTTESSSWQDNIPNGMESGGIANSKNINTIKKMMDNSAKWSSASTDERKKLSEENMRLGKEIGAYYDSKTGEWYTDSSKRKKLYSSIMGTFHTGLKQGQIGTGLKPNELLIKATDDEWVFTDKQMKNLTHNIEGLSRQGQQPVTVELNIDKMLDIDTIDSNVDIPAISREIVGEVYRQLNLQFKNKGFRFVF